ncbi:hypothetical protein AVEN_11940-1 [Araneus ventricosus]|uniref:Uncharacterized protein n=1 Tax=Araneus ventricosus TaxID=182803 RepID=A0A4Y2RKM7_ARAVE|nr:hypothetical protein AVEN_163024-1 [Araneus ventricosus]GBN76211.1 hypothetical protein AVEN_11940-1 [Araneus ventricosus]
MIRDRAFLIGLKEDNSFPFIIPIDCVPYYYRLTIEEGPDEKFPNHWLERRGCGDVNLHVWLYDNFKRTGSVQDDIKAIDTASASVATDEAKERVDELFAANHLLIHLNSPLANETHTYTIACSTDHAHQV